MKTKTLELKLRTATFPQLRRLPKGVRLVRQSPYSGQKRMFGKYAAISAGGKLITLYAGNTIAQARRFALAVINKRLQNVNLFWGDDATMSQYKAAIPR